MSASDVHQYSRVLKRYLPQEGMRWKTRSHVLRGPHRDRRVIAALRNRGVRLRSQEVQHEFVSVFDTAINLVRDGEARNADTAYDYVLAVR